MENYNTKRTSIDFLAVRITFKDAEIINQYIEAREKLEEAEDILRKYYNKKYSNRIDSSTKKEDFIPIKEELRSMPESVSKVLLFRHMLMKEDEFERDELIKDKS